MLFQWSSEGTQYALLENMSHGIFAFYAPAMTMAGALSVTPVRPYVRTYVRTY